MGNVRDREVATDGEVDDRSGHVLGVGALVQDQAQLGRLQVLGRLELHHHGFVLEEGFRLLGRRCRSLVVVPEVGAVAAALPPAPCDGGDPTQEDQETQPDRHRVDVERVLGELAIAGGEQRRWHIDGSLDEADRNRHLLA